jgi:hypothetical protein
MYYVIFKDDSCIVDNKWFTVIYYQGNRIDRVDYFDLETLFERLMRNTY